MLIRTKLVLNLAAQIALVLLTAGAMVYLAQGYAELGQLQRQYADADRLAAQMQRSSDDLTRMARLFVVTRDSRFADNYRQVWRMRQGLEPMPADYDEVYWDLQERKDLPTLDGPQARPTALLDRMREAHMAPEDFSLLADALRRSEALIKVEEQAMGLVDLRGSSQTLNDDDWKQALDMVHGLAYRKAKAEIMVPLRAMREALHRRQAADEAPRRSRLRLAAYLALTSLSLLVLNVVLVAWRFERSVRRPVALLREWAHDVRQGRQGRRMRLGDSSEFGELSLAIDEMAESVERSVGELKEEVARRSRAEQVVRHLANHDALTGLPSLRLLHDRLERAIAHAQRLGQGMALLFVDLNDFKPINDRYGHEAGDQVLKVVAQRLAAALREADTVGRIGGDEFLILLPDVTSVEAARQVRDKLSGLIAQPIFLSVHNLTVQVTAAMGISIYPEMAGDVQSLMRIADQDMYREKAAQKAARAATVEAAARTAS